MYVPVQAHDEDFNGERATRIFFPPPPSCPQNESDQGNWCNWYPSHLVFFVYIFVPFVFWYYFCVCVCVYAQRTRSKKVGSHVRSGVDLPLALFTTKSIGISSYNRKEAKQEKNTPRAMYTAT